MEEAVIAGSELAGSHTRRTASDRPTSRILEGLNPRRGLVEPWKGIGYVSLRG